MSDAFIEKRKQEVANNKILIYAKGTKDQAMCGYSSATIQAFKELGQPFEVVNVLDDPEIYSRLEEFSGWPTFPQIFIDGKLIGGCDITIELYQKGELKKLVDTALAGQKW